ncbi:MAG: hypothetical protein LQ351_006900 [Letrouitia transgressa]|nr:MAG: hypothetical protein LQ351_006900 [Letrouitia transgressa]
MAQQQEQQIEDSSQTGSIYKQASSDGHFHRQVSSFRSFILPSAHPAPNPHPAAPGRYVLYVTLNCPWAHRANILRSLKHLEDLIELAVLDWELGPEGWFFSGRNGADERDPVFGYTKAKDLYLRASPSYSARYTVPFIWDRTAATIVSNESSEIIQMLTSSFDEFLSPAEREAAKGDAGLYPLSLRPRIDELNGWVYDLVNNGVYKTGFASTQEAYEAHLYPLFSALDRLEAHLRDNNNNNNKNSGESGPSSYLFGTHLTLADVRLYTTLIRFDAAYFTLFGCNLRMIRDERHYPLLHAWLRRLYWGEDRHNNAFRATTNFKHIKWGYAKGSQQRAVVPAGPEPDILPL